MGLGTAIKEIAKEKGISLKKLAEKSGVPYNTLYSITKRNSKRVQIDIIQKLASALCVDANELLGCDPVEHKQTRDAAESILDFINAQQISYRDKMYIAYSLIGDALLRSLGEEQ